MPFSIFTLTMPIVVKAYYDFFLVLCFPGSNLVALLVCHLLSSTHYEDMLDIIELIFQRDKNLTSSGVPNINISRTFTMDGDWGDCMGISLTSERVLSFTVTKFVEFDGSK